MSCSLSNKRQWCLWSSWRSLQLPNVRWGEAFLFWQLCLNTSNGKSCSTTEGKKPAITDLASSLEHNKILLYGIQLPTPKVGIFSVLLSCLRQRCATWGLLFSQGIWGDLVLLSSNRRFNIWLLPSELGAQTHHFRPSCRTQIAGRRPCWRYLISYPSWSKRGAQLLWVSFYRPEGTFPLTVLFFLAVSLCCGVTGRPPICITLILKHYFLARHNPFRALRKSRKYGIVVVLIY